MQHLNPISVPFAPLPYKVAAGAALLIFSALTIRWGWNNFGRCLQMLRGLLALPAGSSPPYVLIGMAISLLALAAGMFSGFFMLALVTTAPTIISEVGVAPGAGPPLYTQTLIGWNEVTKVTCYLPPRENWIRSITIYSRDTAVEMGNAGLALDVVLRIVKSRAPRGTVRPCEHVALDHAWSY